jgi:hypothetical protein
MFAVLFLALKRIVDLTLVPVLIAVGLFLIEQTLGLVSWLMLKLGDIVLFLVGLLLAMIPFPDWELSADTFGSTFLDLAQIAGLWPALGFYVTGLGVAFVAKLITLGRFGNG